MRWTLAATLLLLAGCPMSLSCEDACEQTRLDDCADPGMPACDTLCVDLRAEATRAGCDDEWSDLEGCMGEDPICMAVSRCREQLTAHGGCVDMFCASNPSACSARP